MISSPPKVPQKTPLKNSTKTAASKAAPPPTVVAPTAAAIKPKKILAAWRDNVFVFFLVALVALPVGIALGLAWFDVQTTAPGDVPKPVWITPETLHATTTDGIAVKARVSIDAATSSTRSSVERRLNQVGLLLQASLSSMSRQELTGAAGLQAMSDDMLERLNDYLVQEDVAPARAVVVQDFLMSPP